MKQQLTQQHSSSPKATPTRNVTISKGLAGESTAEVDNNSACVLLTRKSRTFSFIHPCFLFSGTSTLLRIVQAKVERSTDAPTVAPPFSKSLGHAPAFEPDTVHAVNPSPVPLDSASSDSGRPAAAEVATTKADPLCAPYCKITLLAILMTALTMV